MYYYVRGKLVHLGMDFAAVDVGGVAYKLFITLNTREKISGYYEKEVLLYTYFNVREDTQELYGFYTEEEKIFFTKLLSVSGVGPKAAVSILSLYTPEKLSSLVSSGDAKAISKASGVGLKTSQKIIIELKGKLDLSSDDGNTSDGNESSLGDAINTLNVLGYTRAEATKALKNVDKSLPLEDIITEALKNLNKF